MKKFAVVIAIALVAAFAAPVLAATNPFMDVPMNHWAYDAIGQLASKGILSGYPDGTYKGKQPTTRYEMASALARALAYVDMTKASKQDVEMLKRLLVEFKDELDALGVRVDDLDKRVKVIESRLGGWKISGVLRQDLESWDHDYGDEAPLSRARLFIERWFGEDEEMHFFARLENSGANNNNNTRATRFYGEVPLGWEVKMTAGRFLFDMGAAYYLDGNTGFSKIMSAGNDSWLTDRVVDGLAFQKEFGMGKVTFYAAHPELTFGYMGSSNEATFDMWELLLVGQLQFTERFGFDLGVQGFFGDDDQYFGYVSGSTTQRAYNLNNFYTIFAGLRFDFSDAVALRGMYYYQDADIDYYNTTTNKWRGYDNDSTNAWRAVIDIKQDLLKFTSLWLEYDSLEQGFILPTGTGALFNEQTSAYDPFNGVIPDDASIWRIAAQQEWNDKWTTYLFYANHSYDNIGLSKTNRVRDAEASQWGVGVIYQYNPNVSFGLGYTDINWNGDAERGGYADDSLVRFRTQITF